MTTKNSLTKRIRFLLHNPARFSYHAGGLELRPYQSPAIQAVVDSIRARKGLTFVWLFPRQSGKDESLATLVQYLLVLFQVTGGEIVFFNPTFKPQTETSMRRLERRLDTNILTLKKWKRKSGYIYKIGAAHCTYMSADPSAHVVSATANLLLLVNEAQDVDILKFDKDIVPMAASTNATKLISGTRWTRDTLLEREYLAALESQKSDGIQRVFFHTAEDVRKSVPAYGLHVDAEIAKLGRQHPLVKTQYFCETIDSQAGMFPPGRQALMHGRHEARQLPAAGCTYAFLIDVAGQDESRSTGEEIMINPGRDSTDLKIVEIDLSTVPTVGKPTYLTVLRMSWKGASHVKIFAAIQALVKRWRPLHIVIDATGVGEGLWSLLDNAFGPDRVLPVKFTPQSKSEIGYGFIGIVETGRYQEYDPFDTTLQLQLDKCRSEIVPGPAKLMRWGVPDGTRGPGGQLVHDDDLMTGALCHILDVLQWSITQPAILVDSKLDPLAEIGGHF